MSYKWNKRDVAAVTLAKIAGIRDDEKRKEVLRNVCAEDNVISIILQRTFHPNYNFDLDKGHLLHRVARKSGHSEKGPFYNSLRRWDIFRVKEEVPMNGEISREVKMRQFIQLYESVSTEDADLLIGIKDKELPWDNMTKEFVVDALPELFPDSFRNTVETEAPEVPVPTREGTKKEICFAIISENPDMPRKDLLALFAEQGVKKNTGIAYYKQYKQEHSS